MVNHMDLPQLSQSLLTTMSISLRSMCPSTYKYKNPIASRGENGSGIPVEYRVWIVDSGIFISGMDTSSTQIVQFRIRVVYEVRTTR
jgi:hypothetical protein